MKKVLQSLLLLTLVIGVTIMPITKVYAATDDDNKAAAQDFPYYDTVNYDSKTYTCSADQINIPGNNNAEKIYNFFIGKGLSAEQAAGVFGNISVESASTYDPEVVQTTLAREPDPSKVSVGWGLIQWTPGSKIIGLLNTADIGTPPNELGTQLNLIWWHMTRTSPTGVSNMYEGYQNVKDVATATVMFEEKMEGAGEPHNDVRIQRANAALRQYGGGSPSTSGDNDTSSCDQGGVVSGGGTASGEGDAATGPLTFPLITSKAVIDKGSVYNGQTLVWCYTSQKNCHHDYNAADIHVPTGTTVIAAKAGTVQHVNAGNTDPNSVTITNADGVNFYQHLGNSTVKVRVGQKISPGDKLGKVGTATDAFGTAPHLHFDMLPNSYSYRPDCASASCSGYPFINVQPTLTALYKKLPDR